MFFSIEYKQVHSYWISGLDFFILTGRKDLIDKFFKGFI